MLMKMTFKELSLDLNWTAQIVCSKHSEVKQMVWFEETEEGRSELLLFSAFSAARAMIFIFLGSS